LITDKVKSACPNKRDKKHKPNQYFFLQTVRPFVKTIPLTVTIIQNRRLSYKTCFCWRQSYFHDCQK